MIHYFVLHLTLSNLFKETVMLNNLSIKKRLVLLTLFTAVGFLINIFFNEQNNQTLQHLNNIKSTVEQMENKIVELRKHEKDFLLKTQMQYHKAFNTTYTLLQNDIKTIEQFLNNERLSNQSIVSFQKTVDKYKQSFEQVVKLQQKLGLTAKEGLYEQLHHSVQLLEKNADEINDFYLLSDILTLRKYENAFLLSKELVFVEEFKFLIDNLLYDTETKDTVAILKTYKKNFLTLVTEETNIGLSDNQGLKLQMQNNVKKTETLLITLKQEIQGLIQDKTASAMIINLILAISIMIIISLSIYFIATNIAKSIALFQSGLLGFFNYLNKKQEQVEPLKINGKDELSHMATIINNNIQTIQNNMEEDKQIIQESITILAQYEQGDFQGKINQKSSNSTLNELTSVINKMSQNLENNINTILDTFEEYHQADYTHKISTQGIKAHLYQLASGVNGLGQNISDLLKQSLEVGLSLDHSSNILIENVDILNNSSKSAATSLEETAASLEEITSTIVANSNNAEQMNQYTQNLNVSAKTGQSLAHDTNKAMDDITEQVTLITDAITIIDQIAFQTNILSLNAAVEAATAGEAGKGFAVVAQEVRNLASRSAQAAQEIKALVENATNKTASGKQISSKMIDGYDSLLDNIQNATEKIHEIATASKEQEKGIQQINEAINALDQQSQQNAAIASKTYDIAIQTDSIAKEIVQDVNKKEFLGKNELKTEAKKA